MFEMTSSPETKWNNIFYQAMSDNAQQNFINKKISLIELKEIQTKTRKLDAQCEPIIKPETYEHD